MDTHFIQIEKATGNCKEIVNVFNQSMRIQQVEYNDFMFLEAPKDLLFLGRRILKYRLNESGNVVEECPELVEQFNENARLAIVDTYRAQRNMMIKNSDWTQIADNSLGDELRENWRAYRQYLRDFPDTWMPELDENGDLKESFKLPSFDEWITELSAKESL